MSLGSPRYGSPKVPGNDGLPMEFYVKFWDVLGSDLVRVSES